MDALHVSHAKHMMFKWLLATSLTLIVTCHARLLSEPCAQAMDALLQPSPDVVEQCVAVTLLPLAWQTVDTGALEKLCSDACTQRTAQLGQQVERACSGSNDVKDGLAHSSTRSMLAANDVLKRRFVCAREGSAYCYGDLTEYLASATDTDTGDLDPAAFGCTPCGQTLVRSFYELRNAYDDQVTGLLNSWLNVAEELVPGMNATCPTVLAEIAASVSSGGAGDVVSRSTQFLATTFMASMMAAIMF